MPDSVALVRAVVVGGGGFRVPLIHRALLSSALPVAEIVLQDESAVRLDVIASVLQGDGPPLVSTTDLDAALDGAALIFCAVRTGGTAGRVTDERRASAVGVLGQETVGAGGIAFGFRTVPVAQQLAERIAARAPASWTISMTNPAGLITEVLARTLGDRVVGVCDSPIALVRRACAALDLDPGPSLASVTERIEVDYLGLNHLGWLRALRVGGGDELPHLLADPSRLARIEEARLFGADLVRALGALPNEYLYWYYAAREARHAVRAAPQTRGELVHEQQRRFYAAAAADPAQARSLWLRANDERNRSYLAELRAGERAAEDVAAGGYESVAIAAAQALTGGPSARLILNVRNRGVVAAFPDDAVIETVCRVTAEGAVGLPTPAPTLHQLGLMTTVKASERAVIEAALDGSRDALLRAYALHPLVGSLEAARTLAVAT
jgi:6-phospho-beta-glucosidase